MWSRSAHAHKIDPELNKACRTITGNLRATSLSSLYRLAGICPPDIRRKAIEKVERYKQLSDPRHPLYGHQEERQRLKSRHSFVTVAGLEGSSAKAYRLSKWREKDALNANAALPIIQEDLPSGSNLPRKDWVTLNRARAKVAKTGDNLVKWGLSLTAECACGLDPQTIVLSSIHCSDSDLKANNIVARLWIQEWRDKI